MIDASDYCMACNGSGEGMYDGSTCQSCKGRGVAIDETEQQDRDEYLAELRCEEMKYGY